MTEGTRATARAVALAGPCGSGKTQLMEALAFAAGALGSLEPSTRAGRLGDRSPEARARGQSTETSFARFAYLGDAYDILDTPGSAEFSADGVAALAACDVAVVVAEPDPDKVAQLQITLRQLEDLGVPHMLFVNKMDQARGRVRDLLAALQEASRRPLLMRQIPIWDGDAVSGYVDLALERAYVYRPGEPSRQIDIPSDVADREADARFQMLERLADADDDLMEDLLEDRDPDRAAVCADLAAEVADDRSTPVFLGSAITGGGVRRLLKALRHETPSSDHAAERLFGAVPTAPTAYVMKTRTAGQAGLQAMARVFGGALKEGVTVSRPSGDPVRIGGLARVHADTVEKTASVEPGAVAALVRTAGVRAGDALSLEPTAPDVVVDVAAPSPVYARAVEPARREDEVKLSAALQRLCDEDVGLSVAADADTGQMILSGQGDAHLAVAAARLERQFGVVVTLSQPATAFRETIRGAHTARGRHKKQSGGHGQFGDVVIAIAPAARDQGVVFDETISGGVVPRQYFSAVREGVQDALERGPLGFPVVDVSATLTDGSHHSVDSSEIAFRTAGRMAVQAALPECKPVVLEPMDAVRLSAPSETIAKVTALVTGRRGQILGYDARPGWAGWDEVEALMPRAETHDLIIELRAVTQGVGRFTRRPDHMAELTGKTAARVLDAAGAA